MLGPAWLLWASAGFAAKGAVDVVRGKGAQAQSGPAAAVGGGPPQRGGQVSIRVHEFGDDALDEQTLSAVRNAIRLAPAKDLIAFARAIPQFPRASEALFSAAVARSAQPAQSGTPTAHPGAQPPAVAAPAGQPVIGITLAQAQEYEALKRAAVQANGAAKMNGANGHTVAHADKDESGDVVATVDS